MIWYDPFFSWISFWVLSWLPPSLAPGLLSWDLFQAPPCPCSVLCGLYRPSPGGRKKRTRKDAQGHTKTHKPKLGQMARTWKTMQEISSIDLDWEQPKTKALLTTGGRKLHEFGEEQWNTALKYRWFTHFFGGYSSNSHNPTLKWYSKIKKAVWGLLIQGWHYVHLPRNSWELKHQIRPHIWRKANLLTGAVERLVVSDFCWPTNESIWWWERNWALSITFHLV